MTSDKTVYTQQQQGDGGGQWSAVVSGDGDSRVILLFPDKEYVVGRSSDVDICIRHGESSRRHARLFFKGGGWWVEDLGSANGVFISGKRISSQQVNHGDVIQIVEIQILMKLEGEYDAGTPIKKVPEIGTGRKKSSFVLVVCLSVAIGLAVVAVLLLFSGTKSGPKESTVLPVQDEILAPASTVQGLQQSPGDPVGKRSTSTTPDDKTLRAKELYRLGLLFYDNGNLSKAIDYWDAARVYDPDSSLVLKKLARATKELDHEISQHIRLANSHLKYQRFYQAEQELSIVFGLVDDKQDVRYQEAQRKLKQIKQQ